MRYPKFLQENGTIGFVAPAFGCATEPYKSGFEHAQRKWRKQGFALQLGPNCYKGEGVGISSTPENCGKELTDYYCDKNNDCLISCGGGELMCEILDYVDFEKIAAAPPKWYMGYSDNTNFTFLLTTLCDTASIYGPCAASFGMEPWHPSLSDAMALLQGKKLCMEGYGKWERESLKDAEHPYAPYNLTETSVMKYILPDGRTNIESLAAQAAERGGAVGEEKDGTVECAERGVVHVAADAGDAACDGMAMKAHGAGEEGAVDGTQIQFRGRLLGGCMDCLATLPGTKYDRVADFAARYQKDGILWFLEACDLNLMGIRRAMWQMDHAGWFQHCSGFLIGRPLNGMGAAEFGIDQYQAVYEMLAKYRVSILFDLDIGHLPPMMPLICGGLAKVRSNGLSYRVEMSCT